MSIPWFFIHIMKSAGTSLRWTLEEQLGTAVYPTRDELSSNPITGQYLHSNEFIQYANTGSTNVRDKRFIFGHYPFVVTESLIFNVKSAAFFREPIQRSISMINHRKTYGNTELKNFSAIEILQNEAFVRRQIRNYQTKVFAINDLEINANDVFDVDDSAFSRASDNLAKLDFVGITEHMSCSMKLFGKRSGFDVPTSIRKFNVGKPNQIEVNGELISRLQQELHYDLQLYELAKSIFERNRLQVHGSDFRRSTGSLDC